MQQNTAWAPEGRERQSQAGPKGPKPAHRLLVFNIFFRGCFQKLDGTVEQGWTQRVWYCQQEKVFLKAFPQSGWCIAWLLTPPWMGSQCRYSRDKIPQTTSYLSCSREGFRWSRTRRGKLWRLWIAFGSWGKKMHKPFPASTLFVQRPKVPLCTLGEIIQEKPQQSIKMR